MNSKNEEGQTSDQNLSGEYSRVLATFPDELQNLVAHEIKDGNAILAIEYGFPAAPCGFALRVLVKAGR